MYKVLLRGVHGLWTVRVDAPHPQAAMTDAEKRFAGWRALQAATLYPWGDAA